MNCFKVDTDTLEEAIKEYDSKVKEMNSLKNELDICLETLKNEGWNSIAGEAFLKQFDSTWKENVDKYINLIEHLKEVLNQSRNDFFDLIDYVNKLQYID